MYTTLLPLAISLLSVSPFVSFVTASDALNLPHVPRQIDLAPRASTDLKPRHPLKQVTRQQLLERHAKAKLLKARGQQAPPPQQSPIPPTTVTVATGYLDDTVLPLPQNLPFNMVLFGKTQQSSTLQMSTNGFLRFGGGNNRKNNAKLPLKGVGDVVLFAYLDDLVLPNANFALKYTFTNKMVKFTWQTTPFGVNSPTAYVHFELEYLVDTPNLLYIRYSHDSNPAFLNGESAAIGVQSVSDGIAFQYSNKNKNSGGGNLPAGETAFPGRTLIIDTSLGAFTMLG